MSYLILLLWRVIIISVPDTAGPIRHFSSAFTDIPPHHVSRWRESTFRIGMPRLGVKVLRVAHEPLPSYLWESYLPVMIEHSLQRTVIGKVQVHMLDKILGVVGKDLDAKSINRNYLRRVTNSIIRVLLWFRVRWLWRVPGHSLYVVRQCENRDQ